MNRSLSNRLTSMAMAIIVTFGLAGGIHNLAASEAANAANAANAAAAAGAANMAQSGGVPACAKV